MVILHDAPIPPSVNAAYANIPGRGRVASRELREFKKAFALWSLLNTRALKAAAATFSQAKFSLSLIFKLPESTLYTKAGAPKRWDVSNRIKVLEDCLCESMGTDDKWVWSIEAVKELAPQASVDIIMEPWDGKA